MKTTSNAVAIFEIKGNFFLMFSTMLII